MVWMIRLLGRLAWGRAGRYAKVVGRVSEAHKTGRKKEKKRLTYSNLHNPAPSCADARAGSEQAVCRWRVARPAGP